jgi:signal transduction histidine kinase
MKTEAREAGKIHLSAVQDINKQLVEKALRMQCVSYYAFVKSQLLTDTIFEVENSKKHLKKVHTALKTRHSLVSKQRRELAQKNKLIEELNEQLEARIKERTKELEEANRQLQIESEEHKNAREIAEVMNKLKSNFLANISHEIRTPIHAIIGFSSLLKTDKALQPEQRGVYADHIRKNADRLLDTVNDLLDLSRIESGQQPIKVEEVNLTVICREIMDMLQVAYPDKNISFICDQDQKISIDSDNRMVYSAIANVLGNAVKFTDQGYVSVQVAEVEVNGLSTATVTVADTGIGIGEDFLPHVFEDFKQESSGYQRNFEGIGLGLALTKRNMDALGGDVAIRSKKGKGTTVVLSFPKILPNL